MIGFVLRRLFGTVVTIAVLLTLVFFALYLIPGDVVEASLSQSALSPADLAARRRELGLDLPVGQQFLRFLYKTSQWDLGVSWVGGQPVSVIVGQQVPATLELAGAASAVSIMIGLPLGVISAQQRFAALSITGRVLSALLLSAPTMLTGSFLIVIFAVLLRLTPATGQGTPAHLVLPSLAIGLNLAASLGRTAEISIIEMLDQPYMLYARAKGLSYPIALWRHGLRASLPPLLEMAVLQLGFLLTGTVVTENVFARQGLGRLLVTSVLNKDVPVVTSIVMIAVLAFSLLHLLTDISYAWLDPRVRIS